MKLLNIIYTFVITLSLFGCGGGGGGGGVPGIKNESAEGVWTGYAINAQGVSSDIVSLFYDGKYVTLNYVNKDDSSLTPNDRKFYSGSYTITGDNLSSPDTKSYLWDGLNTGSGIMNGTVYSKSTIKSIYEQSEAGTADLEKNSEIAIYETTLSEKNLNNNKLKGSWDVSDADNKLLYDFDIDGSNVSAKASDGCLIEGEINIPKGNLNIFELTFEISGSVCSFNGDYSGLGFLTTKLLPRDDESEVDKLVDVLTFAYSNDAHGFVIEAIK